LYPMSLRHHNFSQFLLEGFAAAFVSQEATNFSPPFIQDWVFSGVLTENVDLASPLFQRAFEYFDTASNGELNLEEVAQGVVKIASGEMQDLEEFLFFLADVEERESLSEENMLEFFGSVVTLYATLGINMLKAERPYLVGECDVSGYAVEDVMREFELMLEDVNTELSSPTGDDDSQRISFYKWLNMRGTLPKLYNKMRTMCRCLLVPSEGFRPAFSASSPCPSDSPNTARNRQLEPKKRPERIKVPTRLDVAGIGMSPIGASPSYRDRSVSPAPLSPPGSGPQSPIHQAFLAELREEKSPSHKPEGMVPPSPISELPLSPKQRTILTEVEVDIQGGAAHSGYAVPPSPAEIKLLGEIEELEDALEQERIKVLNSPKRPEAPVPFVVPDATAPTYPSYPYGSSEDALEQERIKVLNSPKRPEAPVPFVVPDATVPAYNPSLSASPPRDASNLSYPPTGLAATDTAYTGRPVIDTTYSNRVKANESEEEESQSPWASEEPLAAFNRSPSIRAPSRTSSWLNHLASIRNPRV